MFDICLNSGDEELSIEHHIGPLWAKNNNSNFSAHILAWYTWAQFDSKMPKVSLIVDVFWPKYTRGDR